jgi:Dolichyl-phosphate-mannose-protein mannosyltransferase
MTSGLADVAPSEAVLQSGIPRYRFHAIAAVIGLVGVILRVRFFASFAPMSLTRDEAALAMNVVGVDLGQLFRPLALDQAAPVGFMILQKLLVSAVGASEMGLRFLSLLSSILIIPLTYVLLVRLLTPGGTLIGLGLMALSEPLIYYGTTFKQYSFDALVTLILLIAALPGLRQVQGYGRYLLLGIIGAIAVWFSFPSVFVIGGIGLTLIFSDLRGGRLSSALLWGAASAFCALSFGIAYLLLYRHYAGNKSLQDWWIPAFAPFPPRSLTDLKWYVDSFLDMFLLSSLRERGLAAAMALFGAYSLWRDPLHRRFASWLLLPIALTLAASALRRYPFGDRTMLFAVPLFVSLIAAGVAATAATRRGQDMALAAIILGTLLLYPTFVDAKYLINPHARVYQDVKPVLSYIRENWNDGDVLFVHWDAETLYDYYVVKRDYLGMSRYFSLRDVHPGRTASREQKLASYSRQLNAIVGQHRVWFLFGIAGPDEADIVLEVLERRGKRLAGHQGVGAAAYFFEFAPEHRAEKQ